MPFGFDGFRDSAWHPRIVRVPGTISAKNGLLEGGDALLERRMRRQRQAHAAQAAAVDLHRRQLRLRLIHQGLVDQSQPQLATMKINGGRLTGLRMLMATHPPLEERIAALQRPTLR